MENKERFYKALQKNNGQFNETDLGEMMGIDPDETRKIIVELLSEYKIEYKENKACNYNIIKSSGTGKNKF
ncbi:hypothetical protein [Chryseobacterium sp. 3008163]|uniref:hypothetical protein n=1 Tax=Chryseobacterium sp. 3008163 TaxID=2478663 RepID=UPI000F0BE8D3|nr:hypothetical protein [Chryseobacterium sp. 3008163]AYM99113.1 hypothetical protein EAG08_01060 [Chryseobacterium sp. 3008163]